MKKVLFLFSILILLCWGGWNVTSAAAIKDVKPVSSANEVPKHPVYDPIRVGYFSAPPHVFLDERTRKLKGAIYELLENHISPEIGVKFQWDNNPTTIPRQLQTLKSQKKYIACLLLLVPERLTYSLFSKEPYFYGTSVIVVHKSNPLKEVKNASDISHMVFGYSQNAHITPFMRDPAIRLDNVGNSNYHEINMKKLLAHRIDGIYGPGKASTLLFLKKHGLTDEFRLIDLPEKPSPFHVVFSKKLKEEVEEFDRAFEKLGGRKFYLEILNNYIDVSKLRQNTYGN
ncbi:putative ABC transporter, periplasmic binding domain protein [Desulfosarcina variabilis str. Montpellier]